MLLAVDVGNTQTHLGIFGGSDLVEHWRVSTSRSATADELALTLSGLLGVRGMSLDDIVDVIVSSVVPELAPQYRRLAERYLDRDALVVGPGLRTGMPILTDNPREVGADLLVNAVAAYSIASGPCIVVDFGTAITFSPVSAAGEYLGTSIAPGIEISLAALASRAAMLPMVDLQGTPPVVGKNTTASIQGGIIYGYAGMVDGIMHRQREALGGDALGIATGGLARVIEGHARMIDLFDDLLTLTGLRLIYERNSER